MSNIATKEEYQNALINGIREVLDNERKEDVDKYISTIDLDWHYKDYCEDMKIERNKNCTLMGALSGFLSNLYLSFDPDEL